MRSSQAALEANVKSIASSARGGSQCIICEAEISAPRQSTEGKFPLAMSNACSWSDTKTSCVSGMR